MATHTPNYNLSKPENSDTQSSFVGDYCMNMDILDDKLGDIQIIWDELNAIGMALGTYSNWDSHTHGVMTDHDLTVIQFRTSARILEYH